MHLQYLPLIVLYSSKSLNAVCIELEVLFNTAAYNAIALLLCAYLSVLKELKTTSQDILKTSCFLYRKEYIRPLMRNL